MPCFTSLSLSVCDAEGGVRGQGYTLEQLKSGAAFRGGEPSPSFVRYHPHVVVKEERVPGVVLENKGDREMLITSALSRIAAPSHDLPVASIHHRGCCYLKVIAAAFRSLAHERIGLWPTVRDVATLPEHWFLSKAAIPDLTVCQIDSMLHISNSETGRYSAADFFDTVRIMIQSEAKFPSGMLRVMDVRVGGGGPPGLGGSVSIDWLDEAADVGVDQSDDGSVGLDEPFGDPVEDREGRRMDSGSCGCFHPLAPLCAYCSQRKRSEVVYEDATGGTPDLSSVVGSGVKETWDHLLKQRGKGKNTVVLVRDTYGTVPADAPVVAVDRFVKLPVVIADDTGWRTCRLKSGFATLLLPVGSTAKIKGVVYHAATVPIVVGVHGYIEFGCLLPDSQTYVFVRGMDGASRVRWLHGVARTDPTDTFSRFWSHTEEQVAVVAFDPGLQGVLPVPDSLRTTYAEVLRERKAVLADRTIFDGAEVDECGSVISGNERIGYAADMSSDLESGFSVRDGYVFDSKGGKCGTVYPEADDVVLGWAIKERPVHTARYVAAIESFEAGAVRARGVTEFEMLDWLGRMPEPVIENGTWVSQIMPLVNPDGEEVSLEFKEYHLPYIEDELGTLRSGILANVLARDVITYAQSVVGAGMGTHVKLNQMTVLVVGNVLMLPGTSVVFAPTATRMKEEVPVLVFEGNTEAEILVAYGDDAYALDDGGPSDEEGFMPEYY